MTARAVILMLIALAGPAAADLNLYVQPQRSDVPRAYDTGGRELMLPYPMSTSLVFWARPTSDNGTNTYDWSSGRRDGTSQSATDPAWETASGGALVFTASEGDVVTLPAAAISNAMHGKPGGTVLIWLKLADGTPADFTDALGAISSSVNNSHYPFSADGLIYLSTLRAARVDSINDGAFNLEAWHLFTVKTQAGGNWEFWQNLTKVKTASAEATVSCRTVIRIGQGELATCFFNGRIAEIIMLDRYLSDAELTEFYNLRKGTYGL